MFYEVKENKQSITKKSTSAIKNIRESNLSASEHQSARPNHHKIQSIIDRYELNPETVLNDMLAYFPDSVLADFAADMEHDYCDEENC